MMAMTDVPSACPACSAAPLAMAVAARGGQTRARLQLSLPNVHCAACISGVEGILKAVPGVTDARVNLTLKRALVDTDGTLTAEDLAARLTNAGHEAYELDAAALEAGQDTASRDLLMRLGVAGFAMMNVMLLSVAVWSGATEATRDLFHWISAAIAIPTIGFSSQPFFRSAMSALSRARLNMDVPISLAILLAAGMSVFETAQGGDHAYFDAALSLTFFLLAGRYLDQRTRAAARSAAAELAALEVPRATLASGGVVAVDTLAVGDIVRVLPGGRVPVDGVVRLGRTELDRSLLTGETLPAAVGAGDLVHAGETNLTGPIEVEVRATGADTTLRRIADLVAVSEAAKSRYNSLADRAARIYAPVVHLLAFVAFAGWFWATGDWRMAMNVAVATLIITCPCALGLAVPAVSTAASGRLFRAGLLVKHATALERLAEIDTVVFDKTGTLTDGVPTLYRHDADAADLPVARALARASSHPLAAALLAATEGPEARVMHLRELPGDGVEGVWNDLPVRLGRADWVGAEAGDATATWLRIGDADPVAFRFRDRLREGAEGAVSALKHKGFRVILLSGDAAAPVERLARETGIDEAFSGVRPDEKAARVAQLEADGAKVLMVGDGLNDTAALAAAHVSLSPASALDASRTVSDIVLLGKSLAQIPLALDTARSARFRILENFGVAAAYNLVAIPFALSGLATPLAAAIAMSTSSIVVTLNAMRLR